MSCRVSHLSHSIAIGSTPYKLLIPRAAITWAQGVGGSNPLAPTNLSMHFDPSLHYERARCFQSLLRVAPPALQSVAPVRHGRDHAERVWIQQKPTD